MKLDCQEDQEILLHLVNEAVVPVKAAEGFIALRNRIANAEIEEVADAPELTLVAPANLTEEELEKEH